MGGIIDKIVSTIANAETSLAEWLGKRAKKKLKEKYNVLAGDVSEVFMTRGKLHGKFWNIKYDGRVPEEKVKLQGAYEVVYQCRMQGYNDFVLSLFENQLNDFAGKKIKITEFNCIRHLLHRFVLETSVEVYPVNHEIIH